MILLSTMVVIVLVVLPVYDTINSWHNIFFDTYSITWSDGRSPAVFQFVKNSRLFLYEEDMKDVARIDFSENNNVYTPRFNTLPVLPFLLLSKLHLSDLILYKALMISNILVILVILMVFYFLQRLLNLKNTYAFLSTAIAGLSTSLLIYSRYFFVQESVYTLIFISTIYFLVRKKISLKKSVAIIVLSFVLLNIQWMEFHNFQLILVSPSRFPMIFSNYTAGYIYSVFGVDRDWEFVYGFRENPGNAIFLLSNGLFSSLFGAKGFIYNSPFLVMAIFGLFLYKSDDKKLLLFSMLFFWLIFSAWFGWSGGYTPRYVRYFNIPILLLSFFAFYYIQEDKRWWIRALFVALIAISILNVVSIAVRTDWNYELVTQLVSNDWVLFPWVTS